MSAAAERFLAAASASDAAAMAGVLAADVRLHPPTRMRPIEGRERAQVVLGGFTQVLTNVEYELVLDGVEAGGSTTPTSHAIRFGATVAEEEIQGVIMLEVGHDDEIAAATIFVRPLPGLQAFAAAMKNLLAGPGPAPS